MYIVTHLTESIEKKLKRTKQQKKNKRAEKNTKRKKKIWDMQLKPHGRIKIRTRT